MFYACTRPRYQVSVYRTIGPLVFSIIIRFFRHTSWSHETGKTFKDLRFFKYYQIILSYSKQSFNIVYFFHKTILNVNLTSRIVQI